MAHIAYINESEIKFANGGDYIGKVVINNIYDSDGTKAWSKAMVFGWLEIEGFNPDP